MLFRKISDLFRSLFDRKDHNDTIEGDTKGYLRFNEKNGYGAVVSKPVGTHYRKFYDRLWITKLYCDEQLKSNDKTTASVLRSVNPIYDDKALFEFRFTSYPSAEWTKDLFDKQNDHLIEELFEKQLFHKVETIFSFEGNDKVKGRIMIADLDQTVRDGASEECSDGFIDIYDLPPIDTWIYLVRNSSGQRSIYAWVPDKFVNLVDDAIAVNCVECLSWYQ